MTQPTSKRLLTEANAAATYLTHARGVTVMGLGDSQTANGGNVLPRTTAATGDYYYGGSAWHLFTQILSGGKFLHTGNAATAGYTIQQIKTTWLPAVLAAKPTFCTVLCGENNKSTLSTTDLNDLSSIYDQLAAAGITPILCTIPPSASIANVYRLNRWIRRQARLRGLPLADFHAALVDPATGVYTTGLNLTAGDAHPNAAGSMVMARVLTATLAPLLPAGSSADLATDDTGTALLQPGPLFLADNGGTPPFPPSGWAALTTYAAGNFSFSSAAPNPGRYFTINRNGGNDNFTQTQEWTLPAGDIVHLAMNLNLTIPAGGKVEIFIFGQSSYPSNIGYFQFTNAISGTLVLELPVPTGAGTMKVHFRVTGADGTSAAVSQFTVADLTALSIA